MDLKRQFLYYYRKFGFFVLVKAFLIFGVSHYSFAVGGLTGIAFFFSGFIWIFFEEIKAVSSWLKNNLM